MENKEFYIKCDNIALHAKLDFPEEQKEKYPLMIIIHGLTGSMEDRHIKTISETCCSVGYVTLRVDMFGHGKSEGEFKNHTVMHWVLEIMQIIDYARELPFVSGLYLMGHSQGGAAIILAAGLKQEYLKAIIPLSPAVMLKEVACKGNFPNTTFDPNNLKDDILLFGMHEISSNYIRVCRILPFTYAVENFNKPVLIVHSDTDELVPYKYAIELKKNYKNAKLITIEGDDHCYSQKLNIVTNAIADFLKEI